MVTLFNTEIAKENKVKMLKSKILGKMILHFKCYCDNKLKHNWFFNQEVYFDKGFK